VYSSYLIRRSLLLWRRSIEVVRVCSDGSTHLSNTVGVAQLVWGRGGCLQYSASSTMRLRAFIWPFCCSFPFDLRMWRQLRRRWTMQYWLKGRWSFLASFTISRGHESFTRDRLLRLTCKIGNGFEGYSIYRWYKRIGDGTKQRDKLYPRLMLVLILVTLLDFLCNSSQDLRSWPNDDLEGIAELTPI